MENARGTFQGVTSRPFVVYLLIWMTLGLYAIYWYFRAVHFLNSVDREGYQNTKSIKAFVFIFLTLYISGLGYLYVQNLRGVAQPEQPIETTIFLALFLMALSWNVLVPIVLVRLTGRLRRTQSESGAEVTARPWKTLLAYFLWFAAFPYLQHHLNLLAEEVADA